MTNMGNGVKTKPRKSTLDRRSLLLAAAMFAAASAIVSGSQIQSAEAQQQPAGSSGSKPNILVIFGDDIGQSDLSAYTFGVMGYKTPNIDRVAREGMMFTDDRPAVQLCSA